MKQTNSLIWEKSRESSESVHTGLWTSNVGSRVVVWPDLLRAKSNGLERRVAEVPEVPEVSVPLVLEPPAWGSNRIEDRLNALSRLPEDDCPRM